VEHEAGDCSVTSTEAIEALEVALRGSLSISETLPRMAFGMLDPADADYWVLDTRRQTRLLAREAPADVALTITLRPRTLLELFSPEGPSPSAPIILHGDVACLDRLRRAIKTPVSALALRAKGFQ